MRKLTLKQKAFIAETIKTRNPSEAARRVYNIGSKGGSKGKKGIINTSKSMASENLANPDIRAKIEQYLPDDLILGALQSDIEDKPRNRQPELSLAAKIKGLLSDKIDITSNGQVIQGFSYISPVKPNNEAPQANLSPVNKKVK